MSSILQTGRENTAFWEFAGLKVRVPRLQTPSFKPIKYWQYNTLIINMIQSDYKEYNLFEIY
jgi:hypothetical protein